MSYSPTLGRWTSADPKGYVDGMDLYQANLSNPVAYTDPMGLAAWKHDENAKYDAATIAKLKKSIGEEIEKMRKAGEKSDCADVALAGLIRAASTLGLRVQLRYYSGGWKTYDSASNDFNSVEQFEKKVRQNMGAINLWDNTKKKALEKCECGDLIIYDLRSHATDDYKGHTMPVLDVATDAAGKQTFSVAEGHTTQNRGEGTPITRQDYSADDVRQKNNWGGPGRQEKQPDGTWKLVEPGGREWDWTRIGGGR